MPDLARTLETLAKGGARELYRATSAGRSWITCWSRGGAITAATSPSTASSGAGRFGADLRAQSFRLESAAFVGRCAHRLRAAAARPAWAQRARRAARMRSSSRRGHARAGPRARRQLRERPLPRRARAPALLGRRRSDVRWSGSSAALPARTSRRARLGTTHISVVDARGNAASLTASTGAGSGVIVPGTGHPPEQHARRVRPEPVRRRCEPGKRLTSMMAPSIVLRRRARAWWSAAQARSGCAGRSCSSSSTSSGHGMPVEEAI